jgi:hypothetical protein
MKFTFNSVHAIVGTVVVALVSFSIQGGAQAAGITATVRPFGQTGLVGSQWNFSGPIPTGVALSAGARIVTGSLDGQYADPGVGDPDPGAGDFSYLTVGGNSPAAPTASLSFTTALKKFGVFWGTPDDYNKLNFYSGMNLVASFVTQTTVVAGSTQIAGLLPLRTPLGARYVDFAADAGTVFDRVEFESGQAAFEVDNISYSKVPTPAMLPAIVGFGLTALKRRKQAAQA